jgi:hypothetical protein
MSDLGSSARIKRMLKLMTLGVGLAATASLSKAANDFTVNPKTFIPGKSYTVTILASPCGSHNLKDARIVATGAGITFTPPTVPPTHLCDWTGTLTVSQDAEVGDFNIVVQETTASALIPIVVAAKAAGPIPPGLQPTVDLAWTVLPRRISGDSFGARITKLYYPIEVVIGNNSGYDLQVASVQFKLRNFDNNNVPSDSYYIVRSSLQREQLIGARNTTVNIIKAIGPILTGSTVFFNGSTAAAIHHKTIFQGLINVFSNPFEKGVELVFPDQTVQQLINLDNRTLRDGLIIANNTQIRSMVFVNRDLLLRSADETTARKMGSRGGMHKHEYDQQEVMKQLGSLELVGRSISYLNRVSVITNPPGAGPEFTLSPASITQGDAGNRTLAVTLTGDGLAGGTLSASDPRLTITDQKVGDGGKSFTATVDASTVPPGMYTLTLKTASGSQSGQLEVKPQP